MKSSILFPLVCVAVLLAGCGESEDSALKGMPSNPISGADAVGAKLKATFAKEPELQAPIDEVTKSLKAHDLEGAAMGVVVMQRSAAQNRTFEQAQVLNRLMSDLQANIANGVAAGDPASLRAAEALRATASGAGQ